MLRAATGRTQISCWTPSGLVYDRLGWTPYVVGGTCEVHETVEWSGTDSEEAGRDVGSPTVVRYSRRLSDKILVAFHHACDQSDLEIADALIRTLETLVVRRSATPDTGRRRSIDSLVAAHERLWHLKNKDRAES